VGETVSSSSTYMAVCQVSQIFGGMLPLFFLFIFTLIKQTYNNYYSTSRVPSCCPHGFRLAEGLLWSAEPRFELGHALLQADALLS
jgi:hypothetical protein